MNRSNLSFSETFARSSENKKYKIKIYVLMAILIDIIPVNFYPRHTVILKLVLLAVMALQKGGPV